MEWLNYHHLLYFWLVAREGGLAPAAARLRLAHQTVSGQIHALERALGEKLFERQGRRLALTELGRVAYRYADEIFALGSELQETLRGRPSGRPLRLVVGVADAVPKLIARALLLPALSLDEPVRLVCREDKPERLFAALALHELDVVLSDAPVAPRTGVRGLALRRGAQRGAPAPRLPALARRRAVPAADREHQPPARARGLVRGPGDPAAAARRVRGQRAAQGLRAGKPRGVRGARADRRRGRAAVPRAPHRDAARAARALLRDHGGAAAAPPGCRRDLGGGARAAV